ncbi:Inositol 2-dehydrogenase/D-chiro-inositol 3-dehydrogenase [Paenibacillus allorhizoplanae]|uniref:Inositol 2-dehydrogenase/D-chiro-inositol 3-dehydrogenase n=1 Tax=Paenibacillus allorhizoplanae TaxID=2905648 RepID=A0ABN8G2T6_9BACL|nr:Gfo/Idh/MocA family oxidoreductase [Paenibacillus allorhizoplanae]CAH1195907.1 Inositol 2-dehydrogenase/D-chiro-inositol 3-dehydrogenase [Paenibacillus allorhizoplanae]
MSSYRVVVVGCGGMANVWVENMKQRHECEIVALVDIKTEFAQAMAERHGLTCGVYTDIEAAIRDNEANLVLDITIPASHFQIGSSALRHGCDVLGEKPMAATMDEARELIQIADETGKSLAVMQNRRYDANIRAFRELIQSGTIGRVGYVGADFFLGPHFGGFRDAMESPLILDMAIHTFDQARFITGADPVSVYCQEFNPPGSWYAGNASAICIYEMSDGSVFCYRGSWCAEGAPTSWEADWRVTGEQGTALWDGAGAPYAEIVAAGTDEGGKFLREFTRVDANVNWSGRSGHAGCLDEMFAALAEGRRAETDCRDNIKSMAMVLGALDSAKLGQKVDLRSYWN